MDRITRLIDKFLTLARAQELPRLPLALHEPVLDALRLLETRFSREAITVEVDMPADLPLVLGAADQLQQVFLNIFVNAWHAMPHGGAVTITAQACPERQVQWCCSDTGVGMDAAHLARACEPFYTTKGAQGTGLGLAICKQIIDSHRGMMALESTPGIGTTVTILLPQADPEALVAGTAGQR